MLELGPAVDNMAELAGCGSRPGVLLSHGGHLVHLTLDDGGGRAVELPWEEGWGSLEGRVVVACAAGSDGSAVAACTANKDVVLWEWDG